MPLDPNQVGLALIDAARHRLAEGLDTITHCLDQLDEDDVHWRPHEGQNSVSNVILHLCGNIRQWIVSGVGGAPDVRDRPAEFSDRARHTRADLLGRLRDAVAEADDALATADPARLAQAVRIQGFETNVTQAIVDCVAHFAGHVQEIIYVTRMRRGEAYRFRWAPRTEEEGAGSREGRGG